MVARQEARAAVAGDAGTGARPAEANGTAAGRPAVTWAAAGAAGTAAGTESRALPQPLSALDMLLGNTMVSVDIDGSVMNKSEFLASIKAPDYQPSQAVIEQSSVQMYGNAAVVVGVFRVKGMEKGKPYVRRERFVDTWIKTNGTWQCVATTSALITAKQPGD